MTTTGPLLSSPFLSPSGKRTFRRRLLAWYGKHARDLPWRGSRDPYRVWVSEIMLQQTQVATVESYFARFVRELPSIAALAAADEQRVLRLWEGLGYYRRARQLHRAARVILAEHGGAFPVDVSAARKLPGIGRYTAGAILSIAFDARQPILEANTLRLFSRLLAYDGEVTKAAGQQLLWQAATEVLPRLNVGQFNQALMELGSQVCTPRQPACDRCPVAAVCAARAAGVQESLPRAAPKPRIEAVREAAVVVRRRGKVLLLRRAEGERWAGLWDFPRFPLADQRGAALRRELAARVAELAGVRTASPAPLTTLVHAVTRFRITLECHAAEYLSAVRGPRPQAESQWLKPAELETVPLSVTGRKIARLLGAAEERDLHTSPKR